MRFTEDSIITMCNTRIYQVPYRDVQGFFRHFAF